MATKKKPQRTKKIKKKLSAKKARTVKSKKTKVKVPSKAKPRQIARKATARRKRAERRRFPRALAHDMVVTEIQGDYQYLLRAEDISLGGILLKGRVQTSKEDSVLRIPSGGKPIELRATPLYDRSIEGTFGVAFRFKKLSNAQEKALRGLIRNLN